MEAHKCILDLAGSKMQITNKTISLIPKPSNKKVQCAKVTVTENLTIPPGSEMEVMAHIHSKEEGTWLIEGTIFKKLSICVARILTVLRNQRAPIRIVNLDTMPVTLYKNTKIATAKLIGDEVICSTPESEQSTTDLELDILLHPLPKDITESQKEQFLTLMSHYSCVIAKNPMILAILNITLTLMGLHLFNNRQEESHYHVEKQYRPYYKIYWMKKSYHHQKALGHLQLCQSQERMVPHNFVLTIERLMHSHARMYIPYLE